MIKVLTTAIEIGKTDANLIMKTCELDVEQIELANLTRNELTNQLTSLVEQILEIFPLQRAILLYEVKSLSESTCAAQEL